MWFALQDLVSVDVAAASMILAGMCDEMLVMLGIFFGGMAYAKYRRYSKARELLEIRQALKSRGVFKTYQDRATTPTTLKECMAVPAVACLLVNFLEDASAPAKVVG
eukprot:TRINITY_DN4611_c0_g2_i2.p2 TRINITY_DN4611_c0_g2~~TRINITY_DN4611_c0_g2_i2.p2  ORF type:complete len:107 (-),score=15.82 TRINITY_DN4611_c0_g2_i2:377-697(-)